MKVNIEMREIEAPYATGATRLKLVSDHYYLPGTPSPRLWLGTNDHGDPRDMFGLTRAQARRLGQRLIRWANRP